MFPPNLAMVVFRRQTLPSIHVPHIKTALGSVLVPTPLPCVFQHQYRSYPDVATVIVPILNLEYLAPPENIRKPSA